ncbi:hypothetical protein HMPREF9104_01080 [Lentilactobacillus kisonensis F0435]|uniref:Uncharacterized protein n=1 Tax=Lentilactobacillus kisonensis F0435 TaxID=797516 RepID=H1LEQ4_9LACO|nr:hypothetical protein HMPREF9104_01080 [Lentilactobacillus kisonensis F0435]
MFYLHNLYIQLVKYLHWFNTIIVGDIRTAAQSKTLHISTTSKNSRTGNSCWWRLMFRVLIALLRSLYLGQLRKAGICA